MARKRTKGRRGGDTNRKRKVILLRLQGNRCFWCPTEIQYDTATFDEIIPRSNGGKQTLGNIVLACSPCNHGRGKKKAPKWAKRRAAELGAALGAGMLAAREARRAAAYIAAWEAEAVRSDALRMRGDDAQP